MSSTKRQLTEETATTQISDDENENCSKICRLGKCEVCATNEARYTCPKCEVKTCCLSCVQIHKKELECSGIRDRTKYIPLRQMTDMDFMSDYYFLEECTRYTQDRKRDPLKRITRYNKSLPAHLFKLRNAAAERDTKLRFLLSNFTRRKENSTYFDWKLRKILWRVEWIFVNSNNVKYVDERCAEDLTLSELLKKYVQPNAIEKVAKKENLANYQQAESLQILLKAEGIKRSRSRYYRLEASKTLGENLAKKTLVEFPIIYVLCEKNAREFDIIDNDEDVAAETKAYETVLEEIRKEQLKNVWKAARESKCKESGNIIDVDEEEQSNKPKQIVGKLQNSDEILKQTNNFLFSDERFLDALSSDDGNETEEEK